jgi:hypothetical protein
MTTFLTIDRSAARRTGDSLKAILLFSLSGLVLSLALPGGPELLAVLGGY